MDEEKDIEDKKSEEEFKDDDHISLREMMNGFYKHRNKVVFIVMIILVCMGFYYMEIWGEIRLCKRQGGKMMQNLNTQERICSFPEKATYEDCIEYCSEIKYVPKI